jgi:hypothetical protein
MDVGGVAASATGAVAALGGVALNAWFSARRDRELADALQDREDRHLRLQACIEFLTVFRQYRNFIVAGTYDVALQRDADGEIRTAFIKDHPEYTDAVHRVIGNLRLLEGTNTPIVTAAKVVQDLSRQMIIMRNADSARPLPAEIVDQMKAAERAFTATANAELGIASSPRQPA